MKKLLLMIFFAGPLLHAQIAAESQSLGDVARQYRLQKTAQKSATTLTDDDFGASSKSRPLARQGGKVKPSEMQTPAAQRLLAEIRSKKTQAESLQQHMAELKGQMEDGKNPPGRRMMTRLTSQYSSEDAQLRRVQRELDELQEEARRMGFGNAAYDPD